eukprot:328009-Alexandrium_andersonii.AAC.1
MLCTVQFPAVSCARERGGQHTTNNAPLHRVALFCATLHYFAQCNFLQFPRQPPPPRAGNCRQLHCAE